MGPPAVGIHSRTRPHADRPAVPAVPGPLAVPKGDPLRGTPACRRGICTPWGEVSWRGDASYPALALDPAVDRGCGVADRGFFLGGGRSRRVRKRPCATGSNPSTWVRLSRYRRGAAPGTRNESPARARWQAGSPAMGSRSGTQSPTPGVGSVRAAGRSAGWRTDPDFAGW